MNTDTSTTVDAPGAIGSERIGTGSIARRGAIAAAVAAVANVVLVLAATAAGVAPGFRPLNPFPVLLLTVLGVAAATAVYWLLVRRTSTPDRTFLRLASVALVVSFLPDVALLAGDPAATGPGVAVLMVMHVVAAAATVAVLTGWSPR